MAKRSNPLRSLLSLSGIDGETTATLGKKSNQSNHNYLIYLLLGILLVVTTVATTHYFRWSMMGLITFVLAYSSKGIRRRGTIGLNQKK